MARKLTEIQLQELGNWLDKFSLNRVISISKMHREFSDGVIVATILKEMYPKLIDLHNYSPSCSIKLKRNNWETMNNKVFKKLGFAQSAVVLDSISKSIPGYIEQLLYEIIEYETSLRKKRSEEQSQEDDSPFAMNDEILMVNLSKQIGDAIVQVPQKMILYSIYEEVLRESKEKDSKIAALSQKVVHLENIIDLKTERIEELCGQLTKLSVRKIMKKESLSSSSPNSTINLTKPLTTT